MKLPADAFIPPSPARAESYVARVKELEAANAKLLAVLHEVREYFDQRADIASYSDETGDVPNEEMKLLAEVDEAIAKAKETMA